MVTRRDLYEHLATAEGLPEGASVLLDWNHDYVTTNNCSSPDRPVTKLQVAHQGSLDTLCGDLERIEQEMSSMSDAQILGELSTLAARLERLENQAAGKGGRKGGRKGGSRFDG